MQADSAGRRACRQTMQALSCRHSMCWRFLQIIYLLLKAVYWVVYCFVLPGALVVLAAAFVTTATSATSATSACGSAGASTSTAASCTGDVMMAVVLLPPVSPRRGCSEKVFAVDLTGASARLHSVSTCRDVSGSALKHYILGRRQQGPR